MRDGDLEDNDQQACSISELIEAKKQSVRERTKACA